VPDTQQIAAEISKLLLERDVSGRVANAALLSVLILSFIQDGVKRERAHRMLDTYWKSLEPSFTEFKKEHDL
jgi:hypothetical protein